MRRTAFFLTPLAALLAVAMIGCGGSSASPKDLTLEPIPTPTNANARVWVTGDLHTHTFFTDGSHAETEVLENAFGKFGLTWMANSEHGGLGDRSTDGSPWASGLGLGDNADATGKALRGDTQMWRWQSLRDFSWPMLFGGTNGAALVLPGLQSQYPNQTLVQGVEWNVPSHEHASVGIVGVSNGKAIADFEYTFDQSAKDQSRHSGLLTTAANGTVSTKAWPTDVDMFGNALSPKRKTHADAVAGVAYLQKNFKDTGYFMINHPSRKQLYNIEHVRDMLIAGPNVTVGLEGFPGHQKEAARGGYGNGPYYFNTATRTVSGTASADTVDVTHRARTYGGADYMLAKVGGFMDALWGEGQRFWVFVDSDFHSSAVDADFWPGEYAKTYSKAKDKTQASIVSSIKSGNIWIAQGDLINALDFNASVGDGASMGDPALVKTMGEELAAKKGQDVKVTIRFKSPAKNNNGDTPVVDHVDVIVGDVGSKAQPGTGAYLADTNPSTRLQVRLAASQFKTDAEGYKVAVVTIPNVQKSFYIRLRGTNQSLMGGELDSVTGDPLMDEVDFTSYTNTAAKAWADLWFYSNPIFVKAN